LDIGEKRWTAGARVAWASRLGELWPELGDGVNQAA
jgi:hypothetical protein